MSDLAALILSCGENRSVLLVLADWLEEKLGLEATAALLRQPKLQAVTAEPTVLGEFAYFPLGEDALVWLVGVRIESDADERTWQAGTLLGLYAHPRDWPEKWLMIPSVLVQDGSFQGAHSTGVEEDTGVINARTELATFVAQNQAQLRA